VKPVELNGYWTTHSMLEPALIALGLNPCPKLGGGVTCGRWAEAE